MLLVVIVNILYACICPLGKIALRYTSPLFLTGFRMVLAGIIVLAYQYLVRRPHFWFDRKALWPLFWASFFTIYITNWLEFVGLEYLSPARTAFLYNLYPFASALLAFFIGTEFLSGKKWLGISIGLLGSLPLLISIDPAAPKLVKYFGLVSLPELGLLASVIACPFGWVFIQQIVCNKQCDAIMANGITMLIGGAMALVHSMFAEVWLPVPVTNVHAFLLTTGVLLIISNILCNTLYIELLQKYSVTFLSFTGFITPLVTAVFDWLIFGYAVPTTFYISNIFMVLGFFIFYKDELKA